MQNIQTVTKAVQRNRIRRSEDICERCQKLEQVQMLHMSKSFIALFAGIMMILSTCIQTLNAESYQKNGGIQADDLRTEYQTNPVGIGTTIPRLSWKLEDTIRNVMQKSYRIKCATSLADLEKGRNLWWDSGEVFSDQSVNVEYRGKPLVSAQRMYWQVKVKTDKGREYNWSPTGFWETGLMTEADWKAKWIEPTLEENTSVSNPCPILRKEFQIGKEIRKATFYITSHGLYQLKLNGEKIGNQELTPGWTSYNKRLQYQVYDVTDEIKSGNNAIGVILGDGWYRGFFGWEGKRNLYGDKVALLCQLNLTFSDGSEKIVISDKSWKSTTGAIIESEIYNGEIYDANKEQTGWDNPSFVDSDWKYVSERDFGYKTLVASTGSPVRLTRELKPIRIIITPRGETVIDFGQNMVGRIRFRLKGIKGEKITISHAEVLDKEGNFYTANLRTAKQRVEYTFKSDGIESYEPHFTFMGFRYIKISDYEGVIHLDDFTGRVIHSDMEFTGNFECSDSLVNRLQKNIQWGLRGNFVDVPTDCPQRDERMGWTGDAQVFAPTACFNVNAAPFFGKWLKDLEADQRQDGSVPWVVPMVIENGGGTGWSDGYGATGWADAAVIIPWIIYQQYGDIRILREQYLSMKAWEEYMIKKAGNSFLFNTGFHFGDWLSFAEYSSYVYNAPDYGFAGATTEKDLIATAYFYHSTALLEKTASLLGNMDDAKYYASLCPKIKEAFRKEFITPNGKLVSNTQTAYALTLTFGLIPDEFIKIASERLAENVKYFQHLTTGFLGTPVLCSALSDSGYPELAYLLLLNTRYPSWLYAITKGATTIWERWDGIKPDNTFQDAGMNSFNHYAYGAIGNWLYTRVAGIQTDPENPGYKGNIIKPVLSDRLKFAGASHISMYGQIKSRWERNGNNVKLSVTIPANTKARIFIPSNAMSVVYENGEPVENVVGIKVDGKENNYLIVETGSGSFVFTSTL